MRMEGPSLMANASGEAIDPARLLLIGSGLSNRLAAALAAELALPPLLVEVDTGRPAIELLKTSPYDGVVAELGALVDIADGVDERIGRLARVASDALVVVLAAEASISIALGAMRAGAHDCAGQNLDGVALAARIAELARRHGKSRICAARRPDASEAHVPSIPVMRDLVLPMWRQEQKIIEDAIHSFAGNIALAAAALELSPSTIYRKRQAWAELDAKRA